MISSCSFCGKFEYLSSLIGLPWEELLIKETTNFVVLPDIAPLAPGHVLIISKEHISCFGFVPQDQISELELLLREVKILLSKLYRFPVIFEHGPARYKTAGSGEKFRQRSQYEKKLY